MLNNETEKLNLLQWNCRSILPKIFEFEQLLYSEKIDVFCLSETWLEEDTQFKINNYKILRNDREDGYGGVCIGIHKKYKFRKIELSTSTSYEIVAVQIHIDDSNLETLNVISVYIPPANRFNPNELIRDVIKKFSVAKHNGCEKLYCKL